MFPSPTPWARSLLLILATHTQMEDITIDFDNIFHLLPNHRKLDVFLGREKGCEIR